MARKTRLVVTGYGRAALDDLIAAVHDAKGADPLALVTVVVPDNSTGVAARRAMSRDGRGIAAVSFTTVARLAEHLAGTRLARAGRRPAGTPLVLAALRRELARQPGAFAPVAQHRATEEALQRVHRELAGLSKAGLARLEAQSARAADVSRLYRATQRRLADKWYDEGELFASAIDQLIEHPKSAAPIGAIVLFLPQALSPRARSFLATLAECAPCSVVAALTGESDADADVVTLLDTLGFDAPLALPPAANPVSYRSVSDPDDEVRHAVRDLVSAAHSGVSLDRCALLYTASEPYSRIVADQLNAAGVRWFGPSGHTLAATAVGRTVTQIVALAAGGAQRGAFFDLLAAAPTLTRDGRTTPVAAWERVSREAGVVTVSDFVPRLRTFVERAAERAGMSVDEYSADTERMGHRARAAEDLRAELEDLLPRLNSLAKATTWEHAVKRLRALLLRILGDERRRSNWPATERRAADSLDETLSELAGLDAVADRGDDTGLNLAIFARTLAHVIDSRPFRSGRLGDGVLVGGLRDIIGHHVELIIVVGAADGIVPSPTGDDPLLPDRERQGCGELPTSADLVARQHRALLAALRSAERCIVSWPRGDLRQSSDRPPSRWLDLTAGETTVVPSFASSMASLATASTAIEARLRHLAADEPIDDTPFVRGRATVSARSSRHLTEYDGDLSSVSHLTARTFDGTVSATRLQTWVGCPYAYFVQYVLGVNAVDDPALELTIGALDKGNLVHRVLERFIGGWEPETRVPQWTSDAEQSRLSAVFHDEAGRAVAAGRAGRALYWRRTENDLAAKLASFLAADAARLGLTNAAPIATELAFGRGDVPPLGVTLVDGRVVQFTGSIDRVDRSAFGALTVTDYKTGKPDRYSKLGADNPTLGGTHLQLPVYALAAARAFNSNHPVTSAFRFIDSGSDKQYVVTDDVLTQFTTDLTVIVDGISSGLFPAHPESAGGGYVPCSYCDPDGFGTTDLHRWWADKRNDPRLAAYCALTGVEVADIDATDATDATAESLFRDWNDQP